MWQIYLNSALVPENEYKLEGGSISAQREGENGGQSFSWSDNITFFGDAYELIYSTLVTSPTARQNKIAVEIKLKCCDGILFYGKITSEDVQWCDTCEQPNIECSIMEDAQEVAALNCLKSKLVNADVNGFRSQQHRKVNHCIEFRPNIIQDLLITVGLLLMILSLVITPIIFILSLIISAINVILNIIGANQIDFNNSEAGVQSAWSQWLGYLENMKKIMLGCGRGHITPFVRDYINNVCNQCNLQFQSSILNDTNSDYYNLGYFSAPNYKGHFDYSDAQQNYWSLNSPNETGFTFLEKLKPVFNAQWIIEGNILKFERKDELLSNTVWIDLTTIDKSQIDSVCFEYNPEPRPAFGKYQYANDALDVVGNEAKPRFDDIIEWNNPFNPNLSGIIEPFIEFGRMRGRIDGLDADVIQRWQDIPILGSIFNGFDRYLLLNKHLAAFPKLLLLNTSDPIEDTRAVTEAIGSNLSYNKNMSFLENNPNSLYNRFQFIDDPRLTTFVGIIATVKLVYTCAQLESFNINYIVKIEYNGIVYNGKMRSVEFDEDFLTIILEI